MRLLLVRHGQSEWNESRVLQGHADVPLTALGRDQASALAPAIAALRPSRAVTSDLSRARETAERLGHANAFPDPMLREIDVGIWQGRSIAELEALQPAVYSDWRAGTYRPEGGEGWQDFQARIEATLHDEIATGGAQTLLVVCHGGVIRAALQSFLGLEPQQILPVGPASLTALRIGPNGRRAQLELFNYSPRTPDLGAPD
jgi:glucosyl-3-phosphoglycerate phosphatase